MLVTENPIFQLAIFPGGVFALFFGLLLKGIDCKVRARLQCGVGPALLQPFFDLVKLSRKGDPVKATANERIFGASILLGIAAVAAATMPVLIGGIYGKGDALIGLPWIPFLLAVPTLALLAAERLSGAHFAAVRFTRELTLLLIWEGALLLVLFSLVLKVGMNSGGPVVFSLPEILRFQQERGPLLFDPTLLPAFVTYLFFIPALAGEGPFGLGQAEAEFVEGPAHEFSKPVLALFQMMSALRMVAALGLGVALFFPAEQGGSLLLGLSWFFLKCLLLTLASLSLARTTGGHFRIDQLVRLFWKWPAALGLTSLILVLITRSSP
ncbi:NADH-quinone oxidoreductase subunit H [Trichloromonas sp.]|uniref:NADH-quinone oxidoreductase subunit H n=1 Tax=Trichloromonas sp. TaxID=3069249 RepID=UPI003D81BB82